MKYINMQPDWPLRSLIIYQKLEPIINGNLMSVSVGLNSGILQTLTMHKGLQRTANEYAEERMIYKDLISKNEK